MCVRLFVGLSFYLRKINCLQYSLKIILFIGKFSSLLRLMLSVYVIVVCISRISGCQ